MYERNRGRRLIIIGLGVVGLVLIIAFFASRGGGGSNQANVPQRNIVVALQSVPQGTTFTAGEGINTFFGVRQVPENLIPLGAYSSLKQVNDLINSAGCTPQNVPGCRGQVTTTQTLYQNLPVVPGEFSTLGQYRLAAGPAFQIPYGYVGIALSFSPVNSVLGSINPGDDVDVIATYTGGVVSGGGHSDAPQQTQYVMNDLRVIGINGPPAAPTAPGPNNTAPTSASANNAGGGGTILVLARYQQALVIQHLKDAGTWNLSAVLRSAKETDVPHFKTTPVTDRWFFVKTTNHFNFHNGY